VILFIQLKLNLKITSNSLVLRFRFSSDKAIYKLGKKFGCDPHNEAIYLLQMAKDMDLNVIGLSFHIGSASEDYEAYCGAIRTARRIFQEAEEIGFKFTLLDIGGGYPGHNFEAINSFSTFINSSLDEEFPAHDFTNLKIVSEPGTYFVKSAFTLASQIHSRKILRTPNGDIKQIMYYLNEGIYSSFLNIPLVSAFYNPIVFSLN
jgi:ornithine decarboxylase